MLRIAVALAVVGCLATACKSGGGSDPGQPTVVSEDVFRWSAQQAVNAVLLTENDLPANFDLAVDESGDSDDEPDFAFTGDCAEFNESFDTDGDWRDASAEAEAGQFEDPDGDEFSSSAAAFRDVASAEGELGEMERFFNTCTDQFEAIFATYLDASLQQAGLEEGRTITGVAVDVSQISVPAQGEYTHAVRFDMTFNIDGLANRVVSDTVTVRVGRMVASVDATYTGVLEASLEGLRDGVVATIAARLAAEEEKLPS